MLGGWSEGGWSEGGCSEGGPCRAGGSVVVEVRAVGEKPTEGVAGGPCGGGCVLGPRGGTGDGLSIEANEEDGGGPVGARATLDASGEVSVDGAEVVGGGLLADAVGAAAALGGIVWGWKGRRTLASPSRVCDG